MTSRDFVYWCQGLFELAQPKELNAEQTELIRRHLQLVFHHEIDAVNSGGDPAKAAELQAVHDGKASVPSPKFYAPFKPNWPTDSIPFNVTCSC